MAEEFRRVLIDDLDGTEFTDDAGESVRFSLDGKHYIADLKSEHADELRSVLEPFVVGGRPDPNHRAIGKRPTGGGSGGKKASGDVQKVRDWARSQGIEVSERGRLSSEVWDRYYSAIKS